MLSPEAVEKRWRSIFTDRIGGDKFDAPGGGYSFSAVTAEERELNKLNVRGKQDSALLKLSIADPTWKMPNEAWNAGADYFWTQPHATRYTDNNGLNLCPDIGIDRDTQTQIADYLNLAHSKGKVNFNPSWVQYSPGGIKRPLAEYVPTAFFDDDSVLVFPAPSYEVISSRKNTRGAEVVNVPMVRNNKGRWNVDYEAIRKLLWNEKKKKYLYLNVPHNPLGFGYTAEEWKEVLAWAEAYDFTLVIDEAYEHIRFKKGTCSVLDVDGWEERSIVIQSVSKGWNATGLRFGFVVAHPVVIKAMQAVMDVKDSGLFGPSIAMGLWCLKNLQVTEETMQRYLHLHELLADGLAEAGFSGGVPDAGLCQFTPAPTSADDTIFANAAECAKWLREKLRISVMHREVNGKPYLRWAVTITPVPECELPDEEAVIKEVIRRLKSVTFTF